MRNKPEGELKSEFELLYITLFPTDSDSDALISNEVLDYIDFKSWIEERLLVKA